MELSNDTDLAQLANDPLSEKRVARARRGEAAVDDPRIRLDLRASQVGLQLSRFGDWSRLGEGDDDDLRVRGIAQAPPFEGSGQPEGTGSTTLRRWRKLRSASPWVREPTLRWRARG